MRDLRRLSDGPFNNIMKLAKLEIENHIFFFTVNLDYVRATVKELQDERERRRQLILGELMQKLAQHNQEEELIYHSGYVAALRDQIQTYIKVKPGMNGSFIHAHRGILAMRSEIFKNILDSYECKAAPDDNETITLSELNHEELESLMAFLYCGRLPKEKMEKHVYALSLAARNYHISYLQKYCEWHLLKHLNKSNALDVLKIVDHIYPTLKEITMDFIVKNGKDILLSAGYDEFVPKNPHLSLQITKALMMEKDMYDIGLMDFSTRMRLDVTCLNLFKWVWNRLNKFGIDGHEFKFKTR